MKKIYIIIFTILMIPVLVSTVNAQTLQMDAHVGDLRDIEESEYRASAISIIRNSDGELISVTKSVAARYLDDPIIDEFLNSDPEYLVKQGRMNNQDVSLYHIKVEYYNPQCVEKKFEVPGFNNNCDWNQRLFSTSLGLTDTEGVEHIVFRGLNHGEVIRSGDEVEIIWNIFTLD